MKIAYLQIEYSFSLHKAVCDWLQQHWWAARSASMIRKKKEINCCDVMKKIWKKMCNLMNERKMLLNSSALSMRFFFFFFSYFSLLSGELVCFIIGNMRVRMGSHLFASNYYQIYNWTQRYRNIMVNGEISWTSQRTHICIVVV